MTKEEIIEIVKQTDLLGIIDSQYYENESWVPDVVKFAKLVEEKATAELRADIKINQRNLLQKLTRGQG